MAFGGEDDFDFGGELGGEMNTTVPKRSFALEDDEEVFQAKKIGGMDHATNTILNLRASLEERDATIILLKEKLNTANVELDTWRKLFQDESVFPQNVTKEPAGVLEYVQKLEASEARLKEQLTSSRRKETGLVIRLSKREQEISDMKAVVHDLKLSLRPPMLQSRRLLLDPAIHEEFTHMKKELEAAEKKAKDLADDLAAVQFTPHSKTGKMLMAKCRTLQVENEELGREVSEGKMHELETRLAVQKSLTSELKHGYKELNQYVKDLNEEAEKLQQMVHQLQSQSAEKDLQLDVLRNTSQNT